LPDAESVFDSLPRTGALEEGHRRLFVERYPPNAAVWADPQAGWVENSLESIRATADAIGHVAVDDGGPSALEREVQELADATNVDRWTAVAAVTGDRGLSQHAPPPEALALDERDRRIRQLARMREISYIDAASVDEYDDQLGHLARIPT
jgi:hypothetical protein